MVGRLDPRLDISILAQEFETPALASTKRRAVATNLGGRKLTKQKTSSTARPTSSGDFISLVTD